MEILFNKLNPKAIIPSKRDEDAGYDIYSIEDYVYLKPHEKHLFSTGLRCAIEPGYWLMAADRGSTGSKGIHIHCGVIDSGYRGEIFICLCNDNDIPVMFYRKDQVPPEPDNEYKYSLVYPLEKAIAQLIVMENIPSKVQEVDDEKWSFYLNTERGETKLGQSGK